jgi:TonB family protein
MRPVVGNRRVVVSRAERDVPLKLYVDSWRQKIERNGLFGGASGEISELLVSVALRSDGSVEDVTIVRSSGRPELDRAVRRIVQMNERFAAFPPNIAERFDVIVIRRLWRFGQDLRLLEEWH